MTEPMVTEVMLRLLDPSDREALVDWLVDHGWFRDTVLRSWIAPELSRRKA